MQDRFVQSPTSQQQPSNLVAGKPVAAAEVEDAVGKLVQGSQLPESRRRHVGGCRTAEFVDEQIHRLSGLDRAPELLVEAAIAGG